DRPGGCSARGSPPCAGGPPRPWAARCLLQMFHVEPSARPSGCRSLLASTFHVKHRLAGWRASERPPWFHVKQRSPPPARLPCAVVPEKGMWANRAARHRGRSCCGPRDRATPLWPVAPSASTSSSPSSSPAPLGIVGPTPLLGGSCPPGRLPLRSPRAVRARGLRRLLRGPNRPGTDLDVHQTGGLGQQVLTQDHDLAGDGTGAADR